MTELLAVLLDVGAFVLGGVVAILVGYWLLDCYEEHRIRKANEQYTAEER